MEKDAVYLKEMRIGDGTALPAQKLHCFFEVALEEEVLQPFDTLRVFQTLNVA